MIWLTGCYDTPLLSEEVEIGSGWDGYSDWTDCRNNGYEESECSLLDWPQLCEKTAHCTIESEASGIACVRGRAAQAVRREHEATVRDRPGGCPDAPPDDGNDYDSVWGAGIELALGEGAGDADGVGFTIQGFDLDLDKLRVQFVVALEGGVSSNCAGGSPYWHATSEYLGSHVTTSGTYAVWWDEVKWPQEERFDFSPGDATAIQFHVPADKYAPTSFAFCISDIELVRKHD